MARFTKFHDTWQAALVEAGASGREWAVFARLVSNQRSDTFFRSAKMIAAEIGLDVTQVNDAMKALRSRRVLRDGKLVPIIEIAKKSAPGRATTYRVNIPTEFDAWDRTQPGPHDNAWDGTPSDYDDNAWDDTPSESNETLGANHPNARSESPECLESHPAVIERSSLVAGGAPLQGAPTPPALVEDVLRGGGVFGDTPRAQKRAEPKRPPCPSPGAVWDEADGVWFMPPSLESFEAARERMDAAIAAGDDPDPNDLKTYSRGYKAHVQQDGTLRSRSGRKAVETRVRTI